MARNKDRDLKQVMMEEKSRGRRQPLKALSLEEVRQARRVVRMLTDRNCDKATYVSVLRDDFGLKEDAPRFREYVKLWHEYRGGG